MMEGLKWLLSTLIIYIWQKSIGAEKSPVSKKIIYVHVYHYLHCCDIKIIRINKCMCRII